MVSSATFGRNVKCRNMVSIPSRMLNIRTYRVMAFAAVLLFVCLLVLKSLGDFSIGQSFTSSKRFLEEVSSYAVRWHGEHHKDFYGIMFDAGSTGSRIHAFYFRELPGGHTKLISEYFEETKPGLSSYANNPKEGAKSISILLNKAKDTIPVDKREHTPVALKATAGLRLLPANVSMQLLEEIRILFKSSPFIFGDREDVAIMDGLDEGVFAWVTVNFLTGAFDQRDISLSGILDLGGGSTQVAFNPLDKKTTDKSPKDFSDSVSIFGHKYELYCHSYLGLGLMSARAAILAQGSSVSGSTNGQIVRQCPCFPAQFKDSWRFEGKDIEIRGHESYGFESCLAQAAKVVSKVDKPAEINQRKFYSFSYYYDRAVELGLIDKTTGGVIAVGDFVNGAKRECSRKSSSPFLCMDAVYISALLRNGFGFEDSIQLTLRKKINDIEISWALGATLDLFDKRRRS